MLEKNTKQVNAILGMAEAAMRECGKNCWRAEWTNIFPNRWTVKSWPR